MPNDDVRLSAAIAARAVKEHRIGTGQQAGPNYQDCDVRSAREALS